ncbi:MAG: serine hydrolase [Oscillospiraceae bacterium]|nr:serine hydrolase [Oscillospiraceae bacterium]
MKILKKSPEQSIPASQHAAFAPVRTRKGGASRLLSLFLTACAAFLLLPTAALADNAPEPSSETAIVLDAATGEVFYEKQADTRISPADTAKVMTALLAVEAVESGSLSLQTEVTVSATASAEAANGTRLLSAGETLTLENLLYCTLLSSADDAANAVAEAVGGTLVDFVMMMNARAEELGCTGTHFTNATGLYDTDNYSTARDMAQISLEAMDHALFMTLCGTAETTIPATGTSEARTLQNTNALLNENYIYGGGYLYTGATGIKTGYNSSAGYSLIASATDEETGISALCAIFGGSKSGNVYTCFADAASLMNWVFANYSYQDVLDPNVNIASVDVSLGKDVDYVNLRPASAVTLLLPNDYDTDTFTLDIQVYSISQGQSVTAPVSAGEVLGEVSVLRDGQNYGTVKLVAAASVDLSRAQYIRTHLTETLHSTTFLLIFGIVVLIFVAYIVWVIVYRTKRRAYVQAVRQKQAAGTSRKRRHVAPAQETPKIEYFTGDSSRTPEEPPAAAEKPEQPEPDTILFDTLTEEKEPAPTAETPVKSAEKTDSPFGELPFQSTQAERDYFEEFFRQK